MISLSFHALILEMKICKLCKYICEIWDFHVGGEDDLLGSGVV